ncbi:hypothetical protein ACFQ69_13170 [Streptomyces sp. NPDC056470]|uniref:hypothetical protein n=1 Tax=unclassified Streptomyces TaxID=2593676 RepID=UPI00367E7BDF
MAEPTLKDVLDKVVELKNNIETATVDVKNVEMQKMTEKEKKEAEEQKRKEAEEAKKKGEPVPEDPIARISQFKAALIEAEPKILTERQLPMNFITKIDDMHKELKKDALTEWAEAAGLDGFAATWEKFKEGENWVPYLISAFVGLAVPAFLLILATNLKESQRDLQQLFTRFLPGSRRNQILATNDSGRGIGWHTRDHVDRREAGAVAGLSSLTDLPDPARLRPLQDALGAVNTRIAKFNTEVRKLPSARSLTKIAAAVEKVNTAITAAVPTKMASVAEKLVKIAEGVEKYNEHRLDTKALEKANKAVEKSNPTKIRELAKATGKLAGAQRHFNPENLPNANNLRAAAGAANDLARAGGNLTQAFNTFRTAVRSADSAL